MDELARDFIAIEAFADAMKQKMQKNYKEKNRGGWRTCSEEDLWYHLGGHLYKGDPIDIANFAMMIYTVRDNNAN